MGEGNTKLHITSCFNYKYVDNGFMKKKPLTCPLHNNLKRPVPQFAQGFFESACVVLLKCSIFLMLDFCEEEKPTRKELDPL